MLQIQELKKNKNTWVLFHNYTHLNNEILIVPKPSPSDFGERERVHRLFLQLPAAWRIGLDPVIWTERMGLHF